MHPQAPSARTLRRHRRRPSSIPDDPEDVVPAFTDYDLAGRFLAQLKLVPEDFSILSVDSPNELDAFLKTLKTLETVGHKTLVIDPGGNVFYKFAIADFRKDFVLDV